jgi:hypothetical protein
MLKGARERAVAEAGAAWAARQDQGAALRAVEQPCAAMGHPRTTPPARGRTP